MPKYYVSSGQVREVVVANSPENAIVICFKKNLNKTLAMVTMVNEHGFNKIGDDDLFFSTQQVLEKTNLLNNYTIIDPD